MALSHKKTVRKKTCDPRRLTGAFAEMNMGGGKPPPIAETNW